MNAGSMNAGLVHILAYLYCTCSYIIWHWITTYSTTLYIEHSEREVRTISNTLTDHMITCISIICQTNSDILYYCSFFYPFSFFFFFSSFYCIPCSLSKWINLVIIYQCLNIRQILSYLYTMSIICYMYIVHPSFPYIKSQMNSSLMNS